MEFINKSNLIFSEISGEDFRTYEWSNGIEITINRPIYLNVSKSGGHRIFDEQGISHYIPSGWIHLYWKPIKGASNFVM